MSAVSRNDHRPKLVDPAKAKPVGLAVIRQPEPGAIMCSCGGFTFIHQRAKVRDDRAQRHLDKKHQGRGVWL
jgi:hypothetical protein